MEERQLGVLCQAGVKCRRPAGRLVQYSRLETDWLGGSWTQASRRGKVTEFVDGL